MLTDYLKPEYAESQEAREIALQFSNLNPLWTMVLRVPVEHGDNVTRFLKRAVKPEYTFNRRTGGGPRHDGMALTCLRRDATYFKYYFNKKRTPQVTVQPVVQPKYCQCCGQKL